MRTMRTSFLFPLGLKFSCYNLVNSYHTIEMRSFSTAGLFGSFCIACGPSEVSVEGSHGVTQSSSIGGDSSVSTTATPPTGTAGRATELEGSESGVTSDVSEATVPHEFINHPDGGPDNLPDCDPFAQDCPRGQKCVPWDEQGTHTWNGAKCVPVSGDKLPGDPCAAPEGPLAGFDDCALGAICWGVDDQNQGFCVGQCSGSERDRACPDDYYCVINAELYLALCFRTCDPVADNCPDGEKCFPAHDAFYCNANLGLGDVDVNESCEALGDCAKGLTCIDSSAASSACDPQIAGCCQPYCHVPDGACPNPDQQCLPYYDPGLQVPDAAKDVGICSIPR